ncbi:hypothetical protein ON010_g18884 [Phytophthora cinnamomi]|nr:hypothetical protein ON010_g18884 [Phytophthora cinnamomi]
MAVRASQVLAVQEVPGVSQVPGIRNSMDNTRADTLLADEERNSDDGKVEEELHAACLSSFGGPSRKGK